MASDKLTPAFIFANVFKNVSGGVLFIPQVAPWGRWVKDQETFSIPLPMGGVSTWPDPRVTIKKLLDSGKIIVLGDEPKTVVTEEVKVSGKAKAPVVEEVKVPEVPVVTETPVVPSITITSAEYVADTSSVAVAWTVADPGLSNQDRFELTVTKPDGTTDLVKAGKKTSCNYSITDLLVGNYTFVATRTITGGGVYQSAPFEKDITF
jgi:hypothetical protein